MQRSIDKNKEGLTFNDRGADKKLDTQRAVFVWRYIYALSLFTFIRILRYNEDSFFANEEDVTK